MAANLKIKKVKIGSTTYDMDLPSTASPTIAGLTVTGSISEGGTALSGKYSGSGHTHTTAIATTTDTNEVTLAPEGKYKLSAGGTAVVFTMPSDTNTATAADNILDGSNSGTQITYAPYSSTAATSTWVGNDNNAGKLYLGTNNPSKTTRLNYNGYLYATKLYSDGTAVSVSGHTHSYAGSSSAGGAATSANKINTDAGSTTQPVYFSNGIPVATTYSLAKSVPADAKFTDTTYSNATTNAAGLMSATDKTRLDGIWSVWSADGTDDTLVNKVQEVLTAFENFPEADNLTTVLAGKSNTNHTHTTSIATSTGTNQITLGFGSKYAITAGGTSYIFTTPSLGTTSTTACAGDDSRLSDSRTPKSHTHGNITNNGKITSTAVTAASGIVVVDGSDIIQKVTSMSDFRTIIGAGTSSLAIGTTGSTAAAGNHTHSTTLATDTGTSTVTLAYGGKYKLSTGGTSVIFTMPASDDTNTASAADNILDGSNSGTEITYAPYSATTANSTWVGTDGNAGKLYLGTQNPSKTTRLNYNGYLYATKLYSGGTEVAVATSLGDQVTYSLSGSTLTITSK